MSLAERPPDSGAAAPAPPGPLTLLIRAAQHHDTLVRPNANSVGDSTAFSDNIVQDGLAVGTDGGLCTTTNVAPHDAQLTILCVLTLSLPAGQLDIQGLVTMTPTNPGMTADFAVTGGTGTYRNARGDAQATDLDNGDIKLVAHLNLATN